MLRFHSYASELQIIFLCVTEKKILVSYTVEHIHNSEKQDEDNVAIKHKHVTWMFHGFMVRNYIQFCRGGIVLVMVLSMYILHQKKTD